MTKIEFTQMLVNTIICSISTITVVIAMAIEIKFSIHYNKEAKLRQYKLHDTDCTLEKAVSDISVVNEMREANYGILLNNN